MARRQRGCRDHRPCPSCTRAAPTSSVGMLGDSAVLRRCHGYGRRLPSFYSGMRGHKRTRSANGDNALISSDLRTELAPGLVMRDPSDDHPFPLYLDYEGPSAPTFRPNPNGREDGWVNADGGFSRARTKTSLDAMKTVGSLTRDDAGFRRGRIQPVLRYAKDEVSRESASGRHAFCAREPSRGVGSRTRTAPCLCR